MITPAVAVQLTAPDSKPRLSSNSAPGTGVGVGVGVGVGPPVNNEKSSRFGEPVPAFVTLFGVELLMIAAVTVAGEAVGFVSRNRAATPATCGVAIDVPESVLVAVVDVDQHERIDTAGANRSRASP